MSFLKSGDKNKKKTRESCAEYLDYHLIKSNFYTNRLKLRLSIPRIVDDYPSNGTKYS